MKQKVIVTGGAGFIGSHLVDRLVELGYEVTVIDDLSTGDKKNLSKSQDNIKLVKFDLTKGYPKDVEGKYIFHLAALPRVQLSVEKPVEAYHANVTVMINTLEMAKKLGVKRFIFASSSSVTGEQAKLPTDELVEPAPQNPYAYYKLMCELLMDMYFKVYGLSGIAFRFFNAYGPRMSDKGSYKLVFSIWNEQIKNSQPMTITGDGKQSRDFTYVTDLVSGMIAGIKSSKVRGFEVINLGSGEECSINKAAEIFGYPTSYIPQRAFEEKRKMADIKKAKNLLNWEPLVGIEEGIKLVKEANGIS